MNKISKEAGRNTEAWLKLSLKVNNASVFENNFETGEAYSTPELYEFLGYREDEVPKTISDVTRIIHPDDISNVLEAFTSHVNQQTPYYQVEFRVISKSGEWKWVEGSGQIVERNAKGEPVLLLGISKDISERREAIPTLKAQKAILEKSQQIAQMGSWEKDFNTGKTYWSEEKFKILGLNPTKNKASFEKYLKCVHPDDKKAYMEVVESFDKSFGKTHETRHRIIRDSDGQLRYVYLKWQSIRDEEGKPLSNKGIIRDITEEHKKQADTENHPAILNVVFDNSSDGMIYLNKDGSISNCNRAFAGLTGISREDILRKSIFDFTKKQNSQQIQEVLSGVKKFCELRFAKTDNGLMCDYSISLHHISGLYTETVFAFVTKR